MGDWSQLIPDLLVEIARRIPLVEDFTVFRGVCTSWRAAVTNNNFVKSWPTVPLLMLAEKEDNENREFYSLSRGKIWRTLSLPEAKGKKCIESRGWLLTVGGSGEMSLLHPFLRVQIELPHQNTFPDYQELWDLPYDFITRAVLSADPLDTSEFVLMVIHEGVCFLGLWRPGDTTWTRIKTSYQNHDHRALSDVNFYNGKFYAISYAGDIWVGDVSVPVPSVAQHLFCMSDELISAREVYLVESSGALLVVARECWLSDDDETYGVTNFLIIQLDLIRGACEVITSLGERTIFVGHNGAFSVDATNFPGIIKPNCVYFTDDATEIYGQTQQGGGKDMGVYHLVDGKIEQGGGKDMGVYHLVDGKIERFNNIQSLSKICPPNWVAPSF